VQSLIDLGLLHPDDAEQHPERHLVLNCLGSPFEPAIELGGPRTVQRGDTLFLCSDGVWSPLPEPDLVSLLCAEPVLVSVPALVRHAVEQGGASADNATAIAMTWEAIDSLDQAVHSVQVPDGAITTTIAVGPPGEPEDPDPISDEEIERTIREIREAIERTGGA
jgi:protein phosphatase